MNFKARRQAESTIPQIYRNQGLNVNNTKNLREHLSAQSNGKMVKIEARYSIFGGEYR